METLELLNINAVFGIGIPIIAAIGALISFIAFYRQDIAKIKNGRKSIEKPAASRQKVMEISESLHHSSVH